MADEPPDASLDRELTTAIVAAYVRRNQIASDQLGTLISTVHQALASLGKPPPGVSVERTPAVPIRRSVHRDYVVCLECGWRGQMLRRHLTTGHGLTVMNIVLAGNSPATTQSPHQATRIADQCLPKSLVSVAVVGNPARNLNPLHLKAQQDRNRDLGGAGGIEDPWNRSGCLNSRSSTPLRKNQLPGSATRTLRSRM
jgi:ROS/MUCR transcriptional regulator protein